MRNEFRLLFFGKGVLGSTCIEFGGLLALPSALIFFALYLIEYRIEARGSFHGGQQFHATPKSSSERGLSRAGDQDPPRAVRSTGSFSLKSAALRSQNMDGYSLKGFYVALRGA